MQRNASAAQKKAPARPRGPRGPLICRDCGADMGDVRANRRYCVPCLGRRANMLSRRSQFERLRRRGLGERSDYPARSGTLECGRCSGKFEAKWRTRKPQLCAWCRGRAVLANSERKSRRASEARRAARRAINI
ncbi:MAG: hypothetical protein OXU25_02405 [Thaumarchaeota archaeon]|nr:hypothetical protein [Nitrososphaerota archaeon]